MRVPAAIWAKNIPKNRVYDGLFHLSDVLPTLTEAAGIDLGCYTSNWDGVSQWSTLLDEDDEDGPRTGFLYEIDQIFSYYAIQEGGYKLVNGTTSNGIYDGYLGNFVLDSPRQDLDAHFDAIQESTTNQVLSQYSSDDLTKDLVAELLDEAKVVCQEPDRSLKPCNATLAPCLFKIDDDPCETNNLAETSEGKQILQVLTALIEEQYKTALPPRNRDNDPRCDPMYYNYTWTNWFDQLAISGVPVSGQEISVGQLAIQKKHNAKIKIFKPTFPPPNV